VKHRLPGYFIERYADAGCERIIFKAGLPDEQQNEKRRANGIAE
jgi:hypothetical protein